MQGDKLVTIDNMDVRGITAQELASLMLGAPGSRVKLGFEAGEAQFQLHARKQTGRVRIFGISADMPVCAGVVHFAPPSFSSFLLLLLLLLLRHVEQPKGTKNRAIMKSRSFAGNGL
jgi:hypothetical protein